MFVYFQAAEQNNMDPSIVRKREKKKRKAPAPPNPFTGEVDNEEEADGQLELDEEDLNEEVCC